MYRKDRYSYEALRSSTYRIGTHITVYGARNIIRLHKGPEVKLQPRLISVLTVLAAAGGEVVSRQQLIDTVWSEYYTGALALNQSISKLRRALCDTKAEPEIIETIVKTGYRLIPRVSYGAVKRNLLNLPGSWPARLAWLLPIIGVVLHFTLLQKPHPEPVIMMEDPQGLISPDLQAKIQQLATHPETYEQVMQELKAAFPDSNFRIVSEKKGTLMVLGR